MIENLLATLPGDTSQEHFETLLDASQVRIARIVSYGHCSPANDWYDQAEEEWVMVLEGYGVLIFEDFHIVTLHAGDCLHIPAHRKHRVVKTAPDQATVWLAVFYQVGS